MLLTDCSLKLMMLLRF